MESHPSVPVLATSGLDYDVKVWEASGDVTFTMKGLQSVSNEKFSHSI